VKVLSFQIPKPYQHPHYQAPEIELIRLFKQESAPDIVLSTFNLEAPNEISIHFLHEAAKRGQVDQISLFLKHNSSKIDELDSTGNTALHWAVSSSHIEACNVLIDKGLPCHLILTRC
jgi:ankyrin repeat protein